MTLHSIKELFINFSSLIISRITRKTIYTNIILPKYQVNVNKGNKYKSEQPKLIFQDKLAENQIFPVRKI